MYDQKNDVLEEINEANFKCWNPQMKAGHIEYSAKGQDEMGTWEGQRRFNEFYKLVDKLEARWPGIPIQPSHQRKPLVTKTSSSSRKDNST